jgi:tetratricopeptide (TPR) repeat protein
MFEKALKAYDFTLALDKRFYHAIFNRANSLANLEKYRDAILNYKSYLNYDPDNDDANCYVGECYLNLGRQRMAERYYAKALRINPEHDIALFSTGLIRWMEKDYSASIKLIKKAISIESETAEYWFSLARVLVDAGHEKEAGAAFRRASSLNPRQTEIWMNYAEYLHNQGAVKDAIRILKKGIRHNGSDAAIKYLLAAYLFETHDEKEAAFQLETALKLDFNRHDDLFRVYPKAAQNDSVKKLIRSYTPLK